MPLAPAHPEGHAGPKPLGLAEDGAPLEVLRPGDVVSISTQAVEQERQSTSTVDALGNLHVESKHDVRVSGLTLDQAERRVTDALRKRDRFIHVDLQLHERSGQLISVVGAVNKPGKVKLEPSMRVADLLAAAGGVIMLNQEEAGMAFEWADVDRSVVLRDGIALPISVREAMRDAPHHNVRVLPGDVLYVPFATEQTVAVLGQVGRPAVLPLHRGMRLTEVLGAAGGVTADASKDDIRLVRGPIEQPIVYQASLADIADGEQHDVELTAGDTVFVTDSFIEDAGEVFGVVAPIFALVLTGTAIAFALTY